jgi:ATP-binding cassette subfamily F protein 3
MAFPPAARTGDIVLRVEGLAKGFDRTDGNGKSGRLELFKNLSLDILRGEKWGILGPNGSGKTTLLRCLVGEYQPDAGRATVGAQVRLGYFDQQLASVDPALPAMEAVRPPHKEFVEVERRSMLARFGVTGDMAYQAVGSLSGGERNRTALARLAASDANFLVLDEPTNHLDLWARSSLEAALREFDGSVLMVSHDRYFLNQVCDHLLVVEPGRFRVILGNYDTYLHLTKQDRTRGAIAAESAAAGDKAKSPASSDDGKSARRKRKFPYRKAADIERDIQGHEARITELHHLLASPEVHRDGERIKQLMAELDETQAKLPALYEHWEEAAEMNG